MRVCDTITVPTPTVKAAVLVSLKALAANLLTADTGAVAVCTAASIYRGRRNSRVRLAIPLPSPQVDGLAVPLPILCALGLDRRLVPKVIVPTGPLLIFQEL